MPFIQREECFKNLGPIIKLCDISFWDETHKQTVISGDGRGGHFQIRFKRDADGNLDPNGELRPEWHYQKVKYPKENRWCFGVYMKQVDDDGSEFEGVRLEAFDYSGKW